jgi:hypothetical protein
MGRETTNRKKLGKLARGRLSFNKGTYCTVYISRQVVDRNSHTDIT